MDVGCGYFETLQGYASKIVAKFEEGELESKDVAKYGKKLDEWYMEYEKKGLKS